MLPFLEKLDMTHPKATEPFMLSGASVPMEAKASSQDAHCLPQAHFHFRRRWQGLMPDHWRAAPGRPWPGNVKGANLISNLRDRHNVWVAKALGLAPQVLLSPLNYPRSLGWPGMAPYFPETGYFVSKWVCTPQLATLNCLLWMPCTADPEAPKPGSHILMTYGLNLALTYGMDLVLRMF